MVLLDEVEKADLEVMNIFYQVFDKGMLNDGEGREIDFKDTVIFLTGNLASEAIMRACAPGELPVVEDLVAAIRPIQSRHFKPALLARLSIVPFLPLAQEALQSITRLKLARISQRMQAIAEPGARNIDLVISGTLLPRISREVLGHLGPGTLPARPAVDHDAERGCVFEFAGASISRQPGGDHA